MEFGPEIKVDGVIPEWLKDHEIVPIRDHYATRGLWQGNTPVRADATYWPYIRAIRLPANHPHYTTPTPDERAVAPELAERMRALVMAMASEHHERRGADYAEARAIVAALEPVYGDLVEANRICADIIWTWTNRENMCKQLDDAVLKAIKRGRQLEKEGK